MAAWTGIRVVILALASAVSAQSQDLSPVSLRLIENPGGGVFVEWTREAGPSQLLGWQVERQLPGGDVLRVTDRRVEAGLFDPPSTVYRIHDASVLARSGDFLSYRLVLVDLGLREWPVVFASYAVEAETPLPLASKLPQKTAVPVPRDAGPSTPGSRLRILVTNDGLYRLTAGQVAAGLAGYDEEQVARSIAQTNLALSCGGEPVAWRAEEGGAALLFFGQAYRDAYADRNVYFLAPGNGLSMGAADCATPAVAPDPWFWETAHAENDIYFTPLAPGGVEDDYFMWEGVQLTSPTVAWQWTAKVTLADLHPGIKQGTVTAHLASSYNGDSEFDNHTKLFAGGQLLDDRLWAGGVRLDQSGIATNLSGNQVSVALEFRRETNVTTTLVLVDSVDVRYARRMRAQNDQLLFLPEAGTNTLTVRGFSSSAIRVLDVTAPLRPVEIEASIAQEEGADWRVSWSVDPSTARRFLATAVLAQPERMDGICNAQWDGPKTGAPHLVIAPQAMAPVASLLVAYRRQQGLDSILVPLEELFDDFAFGRRDPRAIPRFLAHARARWTVPPEYVCLAGDGHLDYHDHFGQSQSRPNHVPPILDRIPDEGSGMMLTSLGLDNPLADTDGDGNPDLAIGRLPAQTPEALAQMIDRIVAYESADDWKNKVLLIADWDASNSFALACGRRAEQMPPGIGVQQLTRTALTAEPMRTNFVQAMNSGPFLSVYLGHGSNVGMGSPSFFEHNYARSYMPALTNWTEAPLLLAGTCLLNNFASPQTNARCLGKGFLDTASGGPIAVWASAAKASLSISEKTSSAMLDKLFQENEVRLGDLIHPALDVELQDLSPWLVRASVLLGDPGTRVRTSLVLDHIPPTIQIASPTPAATYETAASHLDLAGTAADLSGIKRVLVSNSRYAGESMALGTTNWTLAGLQLEEGANLISAIAYDWAGNSSTSLLQVVRRTVPDGLINGMRKVAGGMELNWNSLAGRSYRIAWAETAWGPYQPLDGTILTTNENGFTTLWLDFKFRQMYFKIIALEEN
jgi:hypothetical protein